MSRETLASLGVSVLFSYEYSMLQGEYAVNTSLSGFWIDEGRFAYR